MATKPLECVADRVAEAAALTGSASPVADSSLITVALCRCPIDIQIPFAAAMLDVSLRAMSDFKSAWLLPIYGMLLMSGLAFLWSVSVDSRGQRGGQGGQRFEVSFCAGV